MSFAEIIDELPRLSQKERQEILRRLQDTSERPAEEARLGPAVGLEWMDGLLVMNTNRIITQAEIEEMLSDFP
jgi:hypothetical protein